MSGKKTCETLKKVRKQIAVANGIPYEPRICNFKGECKGTCPACEAEMRYLENELSKRNAQRKKIDIVGIAKDLIPHKNDLAKHTAAATIAATIGLSALPTDTYAQDSTSVVVVNEGTAITVKGKVKDESGALPGATVTIKGSGKIIETDGDGEFSIEAHIGDTLVANFSGYEDKEVKVTKSHINIEMEPNYEEFPEGFVVEIKPLDNNIPTTLFCCQSSERIPLNFFIDFGNYKRGRLASVQTSTYSGQPGCNQVLHSYGISSLIGTDIDDPSPLIIIDDVESKGNLPTRINPNDINSLKFLEPGSARLIYGTRGSNGAIAIKRVHFKKNDIAYDGTLSLSQFRKRYNFYNTTNNPQDKLFQNAFGHNHQLSLTKDIKKSSIGLSLNYTNQNGVILNTDYEDINGHLFFKSYVKNWLSLGADANFGHKNTNEVANIANPLRRTPTILSFKGTDDNLFVQTLLQDSDAESASYNPIEEIKQSPLACKATNFTGSAYMKFLIIDRHRHVLNWNNHAEICSTNADERYFLPPYVNGEEASLREGDFYDKTLHLKSTLFYQTKKIGNRLSMSVTAEHNRHNWDGVMKESLGVAPSKSFRDYDGEFNTTTFVGQIHFHYYGRYYAYAGGFYDGCSKLNTANQWDFSPSFGAAWRISEEDFIRENESLSKLFTDLKLKVNYSKTSNNYSSQAAYFTNLGNWDNLEREHNKQYEIGVDIDFKNRLEIMANMFIKDNTNLLIKTGGPDATNGLVDKNTTFCNDGAIKTKGFYSSITYPSISTIKNDRNFVWQIGLNFTRFNSEVTSLGNFDAVTEHGDPYGAYQIHHTDMSINRTIVGAAPGRFYGYKAEGIINNQAELTAYENETGREARIGCVKYSKNKQYIGNPNPDFTYGFNTNLGLGPWTLEAVLCGSYGNEVYNLVRQRIEEPTGDAIASDRYVKDGSYLKIHRVALTYKLPRKYTEHMHIEGLHATIASENLHTFTNYNGYDPENPGNALRQGVDEGRYPSPRTFSFSFGFKL